MTNGGRDDLEWNDPRNWHAGPLGIYFSRRDSRLLVPKRNPMLGATINFARPAGVVLLLGLVALVIVLVRR